MSFWDTVLGHHLAETLNHNLPKIADSLSALTKPANRKQHAEIISSDAVAEYLNEEFEKGRRFVSATQLNFTEVLVVTE